MCRNLLMDYERNLYMEEKSSSTIKKYLQIVKEFLGFLGEQELEKALVLQYKEKLMVDHAPTGVNVKLAAVNGFLRFAGRADCCVKSLRIQRQMFANEERELTKAEYQRLLSAAHGTQSYYMLEAIFSTGIRVSELPYITVEAVRRGETIVNNKGKIRHIFLPKKLCKLLKDYIRKHKIQSGSVFVNKSGNAFDRTTVWRKMKALCEKANVAPEKVFPHNLRHLFARIFYQVEKDIVRLADILGHSSIQTTRIYTMESGANHKKGLERVQNALKTV